MEAQYLPVTAIVFENLAMAFLDAIASPSSYPCQ